MSSLETVPGSKLPDSQQEICQVEPHGVQGDSSRVMEELIQEVLINLPLLYHWYECFSEK